MTASRPVVRAPALRLLLLLLLVGAWGPGVPELQGQEPPDTVVVPVPPADTVPAGEPEQVPAAGPDTLGAEVEEPDALRLPPLVGDGVPKGPATGRWSWEGEELLEVRALTLAELLESVPGMVPARGGDYGSPVTVGGFGLGGDRIRVYRDGVEVGPVLGGTPDLARIALVGLGSVRVDRFPGEVRVFLESRLPEDLRPFSLVEVGTGDLETNLFRGSFLHPSVAGGILELGLDRMDTRGTQGRQPGSSTGASLRFTRLFGDRVSLSAELHRASSSRDTVYEPLRVSRTDTGIQARVLLLPGVVASGHWMRSREEGEGLDDPAFPEPERSLDRFGGGVEAALGPVGGRVHASRLSGEGWPGTVTDASAWVTDSRVGGVEGSWTREGGDGTSASRVRLRGWTAPRFGVSLFGSLERGSAGGPPAPPLPVRGEPGEEGEEAPVILPPLPEVRVSDRSTLRVGASVGWRDLQLWGARLSMEPDSLLPLGLPWDAGLSSIPGERRSGWEAGGRIPIPYLTGLALEGWTQQWEVTADTGAWPWLPDRSYEGRLAYHGLFLPTGNLEVHFDVGARGRDPMQVRLRDGEGAEVLETVPFFQSWSARLQIRVVTVRAFVMWENVTLRPGNQDLPGRLLPQTRALYGVRWMLWN